MCNFTTTKKYSVILSPKIEEMHLPDTILLNFRAIDKRHVGEKKWAFSGSRDFSDSSLEIISPDPFNS